jgi:hypothetical protein
VVLRVVPIVRVVVIERRLHRGEEALVFVAAVGAALQLGRELAENLALLGR